MTKFFLWVLLFNVIVMPICLFLADFFLEEYLDLVFIAYKVTYMLMMGMLLVDIVTILINKKRFLKWKD